MTDLFPCCYHPIGWTGPQLTVILSAVAFVVVVVAALSLLGRRQ